VILDARQTTTESKSSKGKISCVPVQAVKAKGHLVINMVVAQICAIFCPHTVLPIRIVLLSCCHRQAC